MVVATGLALSSASSLMAQKIPSPTDLASLTPDAGRLGSREQSAQSEQNDEALLKTLEVKEDPQNDKKNMENILEEEKNLKPVDDMLVGLLLKTVKDIKTPQIWENVIKVPVEVTTKSKNVCLLVRQGFGLLHSGWDVEAHRNFVEAVRRDKDCLMAYTGLLLLSSKNHNLANPYKNRIQDRVHELIDSRKLKDHNYEDYETLYAAFVVAGLNGEAALSQQLLGRITKEYPMDFQAIVLKRLMVSGEPEDESRRYLYLKDWMQRYRYNPLLWVYWLTLNRSNTQSLASAEEILPVAERLIKWDKEMPVWYVIYGDFLNRYGKHDQAAEAFSHAEALYADWAMANAIPAGLDDGIWKVRLFKVMNAFDAGAFDDALKMVDMLEAVEPDLSYRNEVRGIYLWEVKTLKARLYLARNAKGDLKQAMDALPGKEYLKKIHNVSSAAMYLAGLREYVAMRMALEDGQIRAAQQLKERFDKRVSTFAGMKAQSSEFVDRDCFLRGYMSILNMQDSLEMRLAQQLKDEAQVATAKQRLEARLKIPQIRALLPRHYLEAIPE